MSALFLILNAQDAQAVRGPTAAGAALEPMAQADGTTFVLPMAVLDDPAHAVHHALLAALERRALDPTAWEVPQ
ncbi:hypothetical protein [Aquabacter cavernae]|uniref:hypothetical protein n=1 Tax=Aquabacter cavernae TaxID=2496029 RepID=UPI000F8DD18A|nr:hypothetical protein [Aquabacter cavernae]